MNGEEKLNNKSYNFNYNWLLFKVINDRYLFKLESLIIILIIIIALILLFLYILFFKEIFEFVFHSI